MIDYLYFSLKQYKLIQTTVYYLDQPGGSFTPKEEQITSPAKGEILVKRRRTSVCQSDVVIYKHGLPHIKQWPVVILHEACCEVVEIGEGVTKFAVGDPL